ncbi:3-oxoacyl-[acyl-carrier-protein] synthase III C-terminal domain-containing protein [Actinoplanes sp. TFC3]|uniref:3-oxoacyl-[acyl-carrier-protein] synthase III C-terminal domain-containing protein n=1 Tax=Actinoplanes sp. TFC3 TaxID=1710355 RepID=UPI0008318AF3|nr:3-oxoacyl-[acyl-carrier-protein] synthase III C-terminal domain-containing protein [Actinoplanes sp. TFC3]
MLFPHPLALRATRTWLPEKHISAREAVSYGLLDDETATDLGYRQLPVAADAPPAMAVLAARAALTAAQVSGDAVDLLLHAWIHHQGHDLWSPAHYIARELGVGTPPIGIQQLCNGGAAALELAATRLLADPSTATAVITTADRFAEPGFNRWAGDYGIAYGDGATATVLTRADDGPAELYLHALATAAAPELERMHRGDDEFSPAARWHSGTVDLRRTKKAYLTAYGMDSFVAASHRNTAAVVQRCLTEAGLAAGDPRLRAVLLPRLGAKVLHQAYVPVVQALTPAPVRITGRDTGHLGAGDALASVAELVAGDDLRPGDHALVVNAGAGFTWSALLVSRP